MRSTAACQVDVGLPGRLGLFHEAMEDVDGLREAGDVEDAKFVVAVKPDLHHARTDLRHRLEIRWSLTALNQVQLIARIRANVG